MITAAVLVLVVFALFMLVLKFLLESAGGGI